MTVTLTCTDCETEENLVEIRKDLTLCHSHARSRYGVLGAMMIGVPPTPEEALALSEAGLWTGYDSEGDYYSGAGE